jgi:hypothetical protein
MTHKKKEPSIKHGRFALIIALALIAGWMAGDAHSASSSSSGFSVCVSKSNGTMRLASVKKCTSSERRIVLGAEGPQGQPGPQGLAGTQGPKGETGVAGTNGSNATVQTQTWSFTFLSDSCPISFAPDLGTFFKVYKGAGVQSSDLSSTFNWSNTWYKCTATIKAVK